MNKKKTPTLLIIAEKKKYDPAMLEELLHGISTALRLPTTIITPFKLPPSLIQKYPLVDTEKELKTDMLKKADMGLMLEGNVSKQTLDVLAEAKVAPILPNSLETHLYQDYDAVQEKGNCFMYDDSNNSWTIFAAIVRAAETFQFPYDWSNLIKSLKTTIN